jgi:hypothetical protein
MRKESSAPIEPRNASAADAIDASFTGRHSCGACLPGGLGRMIEPIGVSPTTQDQCGLVTWTTTVRHILYWRKCNQP